MATWTDILGNTANTFQVTNVRSPEQNIYYRKSSDGHLYEYLVSAETETDKGAIILGIGYPPVPHPGGSNSYFYKLNATDEDFEIWRKDINGSQSAVVDILDPQLTPPFASNGLVSSDSLIVGWDGSDDPATRVKYVKYSSDGVNWSDGSWSTGDHYMLFEVTIERITHYSFDNKPIIIIAVDRDDGSSEDLYQFTGGVWQAMGLLPFPGVYKWLGYCGGGYYWRGELDGAKWDTMSGSADLSTWTSDSKILPVPSNAIYPIGYKPLPGPSSFGEIYLWNKNTATWEVSALENFGPLTGSRYTNGQDISQMIRLDDGTLIARYWTGSGWNYVQRSEPLMGIYAERPTGSRIWMYRSDDGGKTWRSRGLKTNP